MRSHSEQASFRDLLLADPDLGRVLSPAEVDRAFDLDVQLRHVDLVFDRVYRGGDD